MKLVYVGVGSGGQRAVDPLDFVTWYQGRRQKIFHGGPTKKYRKLAKKITLFSLFQGGGGNKK